jgi:hypothetical protein
MPVPSAIPHIVVGIDDRPPGGGQLLVLVLAHLNWRRRQRRNWPWLKKDNFANSSLLSENLTLTQNIVISLGSNIFQLWVGKENIHRQIMYMGGEL